MSRRPPHQKNTIFVIDYGQQAAIGWNARYTDIVQGIWCE